uniref:Uncharacterized protein n=1 Tax=Ditylenchus dipsaci TaxID=166011 RepID=A0A915CQZ6_9BILA
MGIALNASSLPATNRSNSYHCVMEETLPLDTNYVSIRAVVNERQQAENGYGYITLVFDKATEALEKCNVDDPTLWSFDNSTTPTTRIFHLLASTSSTDTPFASTTIQLKYLRRQEIRFLHDSIELDNKVSSLNYPECNFVPTIDDKTMFQLFIEFYVPQAIVDCGLNLLFPNGFVRTDEKFDNNHTNPIAPNTSRPIPPPIVPTQRGLNDSIVVNISQSVFGGAFGTNENSGGQRSALESNRFIMSISTFVFVALAIYL